MFTKFESLEFTRKKEINKWLFDSSATYTTAVELHDHLLKELGVERSAEAIQKALKRMGRVISYNRSAITETSSEKEGGLVVEPMTFDVFKEYASKFISEEPILSPVPEHLRIVRLEDMGYHEEQEAVALFSDLHYGSRIDKRATGGLAEYNPEIAIRRLELWRNKVLTFTQQWQFHTTVNTLHIFALGDDLEGHGAMFGSQKFQISDSIMFQVMGFVEVMCEVLVSFLERYKKIKIYKVPGNHGRITPSAKEAYVVDNFETLAWELIAARMQSLTGGDWEETEQGVHQLTGGQIEFFIHRSFFALVEVCGWTIMARHGNGIRDITSTYTGASMNKLRMNSIVGEVINYYFMAHHHNAQSIENEIRGETILNGCVVGPSLLSLEMSKAASNLPSQEFMLFHPQHGKTLGARLHLATPEELRQHRVINRGN